MIDPCALVKQGQVDYDDFGYFLHHVSECRDCQRRITSQIETQFKQRQTEIKNG